MHCTYCLSSCAWRPCVYVNSWISARVLASFLEASFYRRSSTIRTDAADQPATSRHITASIVPVLTCCTPSWPFYQSLIQFLNTGQICSQVSFWRPPTTTGIAGTAAVITPKRLENSGIAHTMTAMVKWFLRIGFRPLRTSLPLFRTALRRIFRPVDVCSITGCLSLYRVT